MTPKFVDVETLFNVMNFKPQEPKYIKATKECKGKNESKTFIDYFATGYESFNLEHGNICSNEIIKVKSKHNASIIAILKGKVKINGEEFHEGCTALIMPNNELEMEKVGEEIVDFYICFSQ